MKKLSSNKILFLVFLALATFTYIYEEVGGHKRYEQAERESRLFNVDELGELKEIRLPSAHLKRSEGHFFTGKSNRLADEELINQVFEILSHIKINRVLNNNERTQLDDKRFFPSGSPVIHFTFENAQLSFTLGIKATLSDNFYFKVINQTQLSERWVLAFDSSPMSEVYTQQDDKGEVKYKRLSAVFKLDEKVFYNRYLFQDRSERKWQSVSISNIKDKDFSLDLETATTTPPILAGLKYDREYLAYYHKELLNLKANRLYDFDPSLTLADELAKIHIKEKQGTSLVLSLFRQFGDRHGYFVSTSYNSTIYELDQNSAKGFFVQAQDFWQRKIGLPDTNRFTFSRSDKEYVELALEGKDTFNVRNLTGDKRPVHSHFKKLLDFVGLEADRVATSKEEIKSPIFSMSFGGFYFDFGYNNGELVISDRANKINFYYWVGKNPPIATKYLEYFL